MTSQSGMCTCGNNAVQFQSCGVSSYCTALGKNSCTDSLLPTVRFMWLLDFCTLRSNLQQRSPANCANCTRGPDSMMRQWCSLCHEHSFSLHVTILTGPYWACRLSYITAQISQLAGDNISACYFLLIFCYFFFTTYWFSFSFILDKHFTMAYV